MTPIMVPPEIIVLDKFALTSEFEIRK